MAWNDGTFAGQAFKFSARKCDFEELLSEHVNEYDGIGWDYYDESLEIYKVGDSVRLSETAQKFISESGFSKVYLDHIDGWRTHYSWGEVFTAHRGWRRKRTESGFEINYWPEAWTSSRALACLDTGYYKIVGDAP